jgi:hypothetical protein
MTRYWINRETSVELTETEDANIIHMSVDDKDIIVSGGQTIFEALQRMEGIGEVPALCYNPAVRPYGACRLCTVEISEDGGKSFRFVASCLYPATDGMIVRTNTEKVRKLRKGIIELHPLRPLRPGLPGDHRQVRHLAGEPRHLQGGRCPLLRL